MIGFIFCVILCKGLSFSFEHRHISMWQQNPGWGWPPNQYNQYSQQQGMYLKLNIDDIVLFQ